VKARAAGTASVRRSPAQKRHTASASRLRKGSSLRGLVGPDLAVFLSVQRLCGTDRFFAAVLLATALVTAGCDSESPTASSETSPLITSITPQAPIAGGASQTLLIRGERFLTGLELLLGTPQGTTITVPPSSLQALQASSFQANVVLATPGNYTVTVRNTNNDISPPFTLVVLGSPADSVPLVSAVLPSSLVRGPQMQDITFQGANFVAGLVVQITEPDATFMLQSGSAIGGLTPTQFQLTMVFTKVGTYSLRVVNPSGEASNAVNLFVAQ
jgi:hypothetical protein